MWRVVLSATVGDSGAADGQGSPAYGGLEMGWSTLMLTCSWANVKLRQGCFAHTDALLLQS